MRVINHHSRWCTMEYTESIVKFFIRSVFERACLVIVISIIITHITGFLLYQPYYSKKFTTIGNSFTWRPTNYTKKESITFPHHLFWTIHEWRWTWKWNVLWTYQFWSKGQICHHMKAQWVITRWLKWQLTPSLIIIIWQTINQDGSHL